MADELARLFGVAVSVDTVRRVTEQAGACQVAIEERALERLEQEAPDEPEGPDLQQVSADGAMVLLVGGTWTEVRTAAIGTIKEHDGRVQARELSYFSRHCTAREFIRQTTLPTHERGTRRAGTVVAVSDGAPWLQALIDRQCPDAVRILDFPHAVSYLSQAAQAAFGSGSREAAVWLDEWAPKLKSQEPEDVLTALRALPTSSPEAAEERRKALRYLEARVEQLRYARFQEQGYPIGSGMVESACKLVVEARLKGSGMRWADQNVNPLLALRGRLCSGQWTETWQGIAQEWRAEVHRQRKAGRERRRAKRAEQEQTAEAEAQIETVAAAPRQERVKTIVDGHPTEDHPWKQEPLLSQTRASRRKL